MSIIQPSKELLFLQIDNMSIPTRAVNGLRYGDIKYVGELVQRTELDLLKIKHFGRKSLNDIVEALSDMGLSLGMRLDGFPSREELDHLSEIDRRLYPTAGITIAENQVAAESHHTMSIKLLVQLLSVQDQIKEGFERSIGVQLLRFRVNEVEARKIMEIADHLTKVLYEQVAERWKISEASKELVAKLNDELREETTRDRNQGSAVDGGISGE